MLYFDIPLPVFVFFPSLFLCRFVSVSNWPFCILSSYWSFLFHRATELVEMCRINLLCWKKSIMIHNDCFVYLWQFVTRFVTVGIMWYPGFVSKRLPVWWKKASDSFEFCSMCPGCWSLLFWICSSLFLSVLLPALCCLHLIFSAHSFLLQKLAFFFSTCLLWCFAFGSVLLQNNYASRNVRHCCKTKQKT